MREIVSPLSGIRSPLGPITSILPSYAVLGFKPQLVLDFDDEKYFTRSTKSTFADAITHTRASTATYVDSTGTLQTAAINEPRVGHHVWNGSAWVNEGLLHESEARTNLLTYSEQFDNAYWIKSGVIISANSAVAPDGATTADKIVENTATAIHRLQVNNISVVAGQTYVASIFAKQGERNFINLNFNGVFSARSTFDLDAGVVSATFSGSASVEVLGNGWFRCSVTGVASSTQTSSGFFQINNSGISGDTTYTGDGTSGLYVWGAQLEAASTPSSYIPTNSGSTVTRAADVLTIPAANLPWNPLAVSIQMDGRVTYADTDKATEARFFRWLADGSNFIVSDLVTSGANTGSLAVTQSASAVVDNVSSAASGFAPDILVPYDIASRHGSTFVNAAIDGTALTANLTPVALPDLSATNLQLVFTYNGTIRTFRMWAQDIGDAGLVEATEPSLVPSLSLTFDGTENSFIVEDWSE
jgi:hypothetical protein